jgi:pSer/pThr/pTyr-binding forkhead associated (FHA) protein
VPPYASPQAVADYVIEIVEGPETGRRIPLQGPLEIGRDATAGAPLLQDELISRRHVRLTPVDDGVRVEDLDSRNGTFVDGDEIVGPAHLAAGGRLLVGVTVFQLLSDNEARDGLTVVRPIPAGLTALRPLPSLAPPSVTAVRELPSLAVPEAQPDFVPGAALATTGLDRLLPLLDVHTKSKARGAPIGIFVLSALVVIVYLALR